MAGDERWRDFGVVIDSHCHLTDPRLAEQLDGVLARARAAGVQRVVTIGTDMADDRSCVQLCRGRANVRCAIGIHPNYVQDAADDDSGALRELAGDPAVLALGEMGLDYHYAHAPRQRQREFFERQLQLAVDIDKPVVIHCREATDDCLAILRGFAGIRAVFHCFTGTADEARQILDRGYLLGFTGAITFKKSLALREVVALTPVDRLLIETDAPYLTPEPMRKQKINEPALVVHVAAVVAQIKGLDVDQVGRMTSDNVQRLLGWGGEATNLGD